MAGLVPAISMKIAPRVPYQDRSSDVEGNVVFTFLDASKEFKGLLPNRSGETAALPLLPRAGCDCTQDMSNKSQPTFAEYAAARKVADYIDEVNNAKSARSSTTR